MDRNTTPYVVRLLMSIGGPKLKALVEWIESIRNEHEDVEMFDWTKGDGYDLWYIEIKDRRITEKIVNVIFGLTVDVKNDCIFWSNDTTSYGGRFSKGGNCFIRSERWWRRLRKQYPEATSDHTQPGVGTVHDYRRSSGSLKKKAG